MTEAVARIMTAVEQLSTNEKAELACAVLDAMGSEEDGLDEAWEAKLTQRADDIRLGRAVGKPVEEVFARWKARRS